MSDLTIKTDPPMAQHLIASGALARTDFVLLDVGVSGGIDKQWRVFGEGLHAYGFDPWVEEIEKLARDESSPNVRYFANLVGIVDPDHWYHHSIPGEPTSKWYQREIARKGPSDLVFDPFPRSSLLLARRNRPPARQSPSVRVGEKVQLDHFVREMGIKQVDFIKIDTDGDDVEVLYGCEDIIDSHAVLGFCVESQFHGPVGDKTNTFANIDRFLRAKGFQLFDTSIHRYSRSSLPAPFELNIPAQTTFGQVMWGDAVYFRDPVAPGYEDYWKISLSADKLLKLACLYEIYSLPDCAAELILAFRDRFDEGIDVPEILDLLTPRLNGVSLGYQEYVEEFSARPEQFFPMPADLPLHEMRIPNDHLSTRDRVMILEEQVNTLKQAVRLKDTIIESKDYSIQRLQNLYTEMLKQQLALEE